MKQIRKILAFFVGDAVVTKFKCNHLCHRNRGRKNVRCVYGKYFDCR